MLSLAGILALVLEVRRRRRVEARLESVLQQLQASLKEIKTLRGIVPICARSRATRTDGHRGARHGHAGSPRSLSDLQV